MKGSKLYDVFYISNYTTVPGYLVVLKTKALRDDLFFTIYNVLFVKKHS